MDDEYYITLTALPDPADVQIGHTRYSLQKKLRPDQSDS